MSPGELVEKEERWISKTTAQIKVKIGQKGRSLPVILPNQPQQMQIQPSQTKLPLPRMPICALEVGRPGLARRVNVPAATALIGNQRQLQRIRYLAYKIRVVADAPQPVRDGQVGPFEVA